MSGFMAGALGSMVGMGGAFVALPFMTNYLRVPTHTAHATSTAVVFLTALSGSLMFYLAASSSSDEEEKQNKDGTVLAAVGALPLTSSSSSTSSKVNIGAAITICAASVPLSLVGVRLARHMSAFTLHTLLGGWMMLVAPLSIYSDQIKKATVIRPESSLNSNAAGDYQHPSWISSSPVLTEFCEKYRIQFQDSLNLLAIGGGSGLLAGMFGVGFVCV